jgi:hypothetical protein
MGFPRDEVSQLLRACHRRCCVCHRFCGVKMETDHIVPAAEGGSDTIDNAIPVCFECHAEIHSYNDKHPRGRKFLPDELRPQRTMAKICLDRPDVFVNAAETRTSVLYRLSLTNSESPCSRPSNDPLQSVVLFMMSNSTEPSAKGQSLTTRWSEQAILAIAQSVLRIIDRRDESQCSRR